MLQDNVEGYRKEIASLRDKGQKTAAASQKHEQTAVTLNEDLKAAKEKLSMAEVYKSYNTITIHIHVFTTFFIAICICEYLMNADLCFLRVMLRAFAKRETC